jgi:hypothetical protein
VLVDTSHDAALFARGERLALEAGDTVIEALLDEVRVHLAGLLSGGLLQRTARPVSWAYIHELLHLLLLHAGLQLALLGGRKAGTSSAWVIVLVQGSAYESMFGVWCVRLRVRLGRQPVGD